MTPRLTAAITVLIITLLGALLILATGSSYLACEAQAINLALPLNTQRQIWGSNLAVQTFRSPFPQLNRLDLFLQTYFRRNTARVTIRLVDISTQPDPLAPTARASFETTFDPSSLPAQSWQSFTFTPVADSVHKTYAIVIASPQAEPGNAITFGGIENADPYQPGQAAIGGSAFPGDIAFRACFQMSLAEKLRILARQITQYRPWLWGNAVFYGGLLLLYGVLIGLLFWRLAKLVN